MPFDDSYGRTSQEFRIPLRVVDAVYGSDNRDNGGDDILYCICSAFDFPEQCKIEFAFDREYENPWYHAMVYTVYGITRLQYDRVVERLSEHRLMVE